MLNPKALDLDAIRFADKKVTLGIKCDPDLKIRLAEEAESIQLTLSSYVEQLLANVESKDIYIKYLEGVETRLTQEFNKQNDLVNFYENDLLKKLFKDNKGQTISYINNNDSTQEIKIQSLRDVYTVIIHSFK